MANGSTRLGDLGITIKDTAQELLLLQQNETTFMGLAVSKDNVKVLPSLQLEGETELTVGGNGIKLGIEGSLALQVNAFNSIDDVDSDSVISLSVGEGWLKNDLGASVKLTAAGTVGSADLGLETGAEAHLLDYRRHNLTDLVAKAVVDSFEGARFATRFEDVKKAAEGNDKLALLARGKISFSASLSTTDVFAASVSALDRVLGVAGASAFTMTVGSSVSLKVGITDDFRLVFSQGSVKPLAVELKKSLGRRTSAQASLGVKVGFSDPEKLSDLIATYLTGRFGEPLQQIKDLLDRLDEATSFEDLNPALKPLAERLADRLGISTIQDRLAALKKNIESFDEAIKSAVSKKVELAFTFSYTRIELNETLLKFEVMPDAFEGSFNKLVLGDTEDVIAKILQKDQSFHLDEYLQTRQIQTTRSFGASLRIGDWAAGGTTTITRNRKEQRDINGRIRVNLDGRKSYKAAWNKDVEEYGFELGAAMDKFVASPRGSDFTLRLGLNWMWKDEMGPKLAETIADVATVWRIIDVTQRNHIQNALRQLQGQVQADLELTIDDAGVRQLARATGADLQAAWIRAMAEALPLIFFKDRTFRRTLQDRLFIYAVAADRLFADPFVEIPTGLRHREGEERLRTIDLELDRGKPNSISEVFVPISLKELWLRGDRHRDRCKQAFRGLGRLHSFTEESGDSDDFLDAFRMLQDLVSQAFTARMMGSVLATLLEGNRNSISATGKVVPTGGGDAIVIA